MPTLDQALVLAILTAMVALFVWDRLRFDLVALLGLLAAMASGVVPPDRAFAGFGDQVVVIVASVLMLSAAVGKSGAIGRAVRRLEPRLRTTGARVAALTAGVTVLSAFMKNIGALAVFLPIAVQVARRGGTSPSILLMPMAFGSLVGGLVTLVGTSPNILVSRARAELAGEPFGMFDFAPVGLGVAAAALAFLSVGWRLLPAERLIAQHQRGPLLDVVLVASAQAIEHHEIAAYGTMRTLARSSGMGAVADPLEQTPWEEKATDEKLTGLAEGEINPAALQQSA